MKLSLLLLAALPLSAQADAWTDAFTIETAPNPPGVDPQIGGLATLPDGRIAACFHRGEVMIYDPAKKSWSLFASGLQEPLGIVAENASTFVVMQRAELTRLTDTNGDGQADTYRTVFDRFGMTGNYHEFAFGPALGPDGHYYIGLNLASNGAGIRPEIRGNWSPIGDVSQQQMVAGPDFKKYSAKAGRMYSRVDWRGWILRISPDGKSMEPFASGFRSPDGVGFDAAGNLLVTDNQGDWRGSSPLHHVTKGGFYGHPASLVWTPGWELGDPLKLPVAELEKLRSPETGVFPQGDLANSPTQPIPIPANTFGDFAGHTLIGEMNASRLVRFLGEKVDGTLQGALIPFLDTKALGNGNHRLTFTPDGSLWVGKTHLSWAGSTGLTRINPTGKPFFAITSCKITPEGFTVTFNRPVDAAKLSKLLAEPIPNPQEPRTKTDVAEKLPQSQRVNYYAYKYHSNYGSPKILETDPGFSPALSPDGRTLTLTIGPNKTGPVRQGVIYAFDFKGLVSAEGLSLLGDKVYYNVVRLAK